MSTIPTSLTEKAFDEHVRPYISDGFCKVKKKE